LKKITALAAIALSFATSAFAQGAYIGGAVGVADADIDCAGTLACDTQSTGYKAFAGYKFNRFVAAEIGYMNLGKSTATVDVGPLVDVAIKNSGFTAGVAGFLPFSQQFTGVGRLGVYFNKTKVSGASGGFGVSMDESNTSAYAGLGVGFAVTKQLSIDAGFDVTNMEFQGEQNNVVLWSLGLRYGF
jgi:OOP family OmpA-OmpF porin